ncbi:MAG: ImmA/IrrE family metallo-endopeptidase [Erysipelotrichaceae bacterium]|nr:ImmA/IrrE family metallo-endopeptidase [Erysipelotrichaceae bacterium]
MTNKVYIKKEIFLWAIDESQISLSYIENKFPKINKWIDGDEKPTFKQLQAFSQFLKIPFGYFFLQTPPKYDGIKKDFRTINNKINNQLSKDLKDTLVLMDFKKNWMSDYRKQQGWEPLNLKHNINENTSINEICTSIFRLLKINNEWFTNCKNHDNAYKYLKKHIEDIGVIVMQNGVVGQNNNRSLQVKEFRAFVLDDPYAPLIFINKNDSQTGMIFSLIHEFVHLLFSDDDILIDNENTITNNERKINNITAVLLIPEDYIIRNWDYNQDIINQIDKFSNILHVSPYALSIRLNKLNIIDNSIVNIIRGRTNSVIKNKKSGGNFYSTQISRIGIPFADAVFSQSESGTLRYTDAYRLLGIKDMKSYDKLKDYRYSEETRHA